MVEPTEQPLQPRSGARVLQAAWIAYWLVLTFLLLSPKLPRPPVPLDRRGLIAHATTFALLAAGAVVVRWAQGRTLTAKWLIGAGLLFAVYGGLAEVIQPLVNRHSSFLDWLADVGGVLAGFLLAACFFRPQTLVSEAE